MVAYDVRIAAPDARILDYALLKSQAGTWAAFLSDGIAAFADLVERVNAAPGRWVVNNSWGLFDRASDAPIGSRSEEHTSELQSQSNLVCRLLLEKKKRSIPALRNVLLYQALISDMLLSLFLLGLSHTHHGIMTHFNDLPFKMSLFDMFGASHDIF